MTGKSDTTTIAIIHPEFQDKIIDKAIGNNLMNRILGFILLLLISVLSFGQEKDFYDLDNSYHEIFKNNKVKSLKVLRKDFDKIGDIKEKYIELIQNFARNGDIVWEKEFYDDSTAAWEVNYKYNEQHQTTRTEWTWLDEDDQELTEYEYDSDNRLIKSRDYYKSSNSTEFILEECQNYFYKNNRISKVTNLENEIESYYKKKGKVIFGYTADNKLKYKYKNGEFVYQNLDSIIFQYKRNRIGQILKTRKTDKTGTILSNTAYEYSNGLLMKVVAKDGNGNLMREEEYHYEYYK
ncbi:hypothetical protein [Ulvibacterium marinum]|uniref:Uncharacterized protein n=1 Tax=Ulvibacterium marinum TaxID=2419782 RepID=A0A3B0C1U7_9FLAO|nr:hypothetical protein [Ulvibacterium marinum]RKN79843.1 hypothetical protein D7Z94_16350 [Ulvibacterium marinum]